MNTGNPREKTRGVLLADLASAVNELTEPRRHTEYIIQTISEQVVTRRGTIRMRSRRERLPHSVTFPSLLEALLEAMVPASTDLGAGSSSNSFESRPPAELEAIRVMRDIMIDTERWATTLKVQRRTLVATLHGLVGADLTIEQLRRLVRDVNRWVRAARLTTGWDAPSRNVDQACPTCGAANSIRITGEFDKAMCTRCGARWDHDTLGQLAEILRANQTQTVAADLPCPWPNCGRRGPHEYHDDGFGRVFRDRCDASERDAPKWSFGDVRPSA